MRAVLWVCFLGVALFMCLIPIRTSDAQEPPLNDTFFPYVPRSNQSPSMAGIIGVSVSTVLLAVFSCSFVFILGTYEECCLRNTYTSSASHSSKVGSRYGGSRYGTRSVKPQQRYNQYKPPGHVASSGV